LQSEPVEPCSSRSKFPKWKKPKSAVAAGMKVTGLRSLQPTVEFRIDGLKVKAAYLFANAPKLFRREPREGAEELRHVV